MCVCGFVYKHFFFVKDFSGTTEPRILKVGTNVGYNLLYCVRENHHPTAYRSHYFHFSFSPIKFSVTDFSASMRAKSSNFVYTLRGKENQDAEINFCLLFFFHFCFFPSLTPM